MPTLHLPGNLCVKSDRDELFDALGGMMMACAVRSIADRGAFHLALSGGSTPEPFYRHLMIDLRFRAFPWNHTHLWLVDERRVPAADDQSNWKMIRQCIADHVTTTRRYLHPMPVTHADAADLYERELREVMKVPDRSLTPRLDFVLLGMGGDGHTASLFPGSSALNEHSRLITANDGAGVTPPPRLTMTYRLLNAGHELAVLVTGDGKTRTLRNVSEHLQTHGPCPAKYPITGIQPHSPTALTWFLDHAAAGIK